ncbi:TPA: hypothetical protein DCG61_02405 [Patescibacteria group bacterium]|nr:hypothetical protein [Patescibacteria group bacterium]
MTKEKFVRPVTYTGLKTTLGPVDQENDIQYLWKWINDPAVAKFTLQSWPVHLYAEKEYVEKIHQRSSDVIFAISTLEGEFIGMMGLHNISLIHGTATSGALIGESKFRGQHLGRDAKMLLLYHAFQILGLRKVCSAVKGFNKPSQIYLDANGYKKEWVREKMFYFEGEYHDEIFFSISREDFLPRWSDYTDKLAKVKSKSKKGRK